MINTVEMDIKTEIWDTIDYAARENVGVVSYSEVRARMAVLEMAEITDSDILDVICSSIFEYILGDEYLVNRNFI
jgi:hypothetical protein